MNVSKDDAARALKEIGAAGRRMGLIKNYAMAAPFLILWGLIWLGANLATNIDYGLGRGAWLAGMLIGIPATILLTVRQSRATGATISQQGGDAKAFGLRLAMTGFTLLCLFAAIMAVIGPLDGRQTNSFISLIWAFIYMLAGIWIGWRLFWIGAVTAVAIMFGYFMVDQHFFLWMGVVGGGALIAGGLWLRKI